MPKPSIRITCDDGTANSIKIFDAETGHEIVGVSEIAIYPIRQGRPVSARVTFCQVSLEMRGINVDQMELECIQGRLPIGDREDHTQ